MGSRCPLDDSGRVVEAARTDGLYGVMSSTVSHSLATRTARKLPARVGYPLSKESSEKGPFLLKTDSK